MVKKSRPIHHQVLLSPEDAAALETLSTEAGAVSRAAWIRAAIRAASEVQATQRSIKRHVNNDTGWGGARPGAGRPKGSGTRKVRR